MLYEERLEVMRREQRERDLQFQMEMRNEERAWQQAQLSEERRWQIVMAFFTSVLTLLGAILLFCL